MGWITSENGLRAILGKTVYSKFKAVFDACCGGISTEGDPNKFLNQQGEFTSAGGGSQNLEQTLTVGNDAGGLDAVNFGNVGILSLIHI